MDEFVNKIRTKDGSEYGIHDERVDNAQEGTVVKVLGLDSEGGVVKGNAPSGGLTILNLGEIPPEAISDGADTPQSIINLLGEDNPILKATIQDSTYYFYLQCDAGLFSSTLQLEYLTNYLGGSPLANNVYAIVFSENKTTYKMAN